MPTIECINGIKINIYNGDHRPPHIHAVYNEFEALITIEELTVYAGSLPKRQQKTVFNWLSENTDWLLQVFHDLNPELK